MEKYFDLKIIVIKSLLFLIDCFIVVICRRGHHIVVSASTNAFVLCVVLAIPCILTLTPVPCFPICIRCYDVGVGHCLCPKRFTLCNFPQLSRLLSASALSLLVTVAWIVCGQLLIDGACEKRCAPLHQV